MRKSDAQLGSPELPFSDTAANLANFTTEGMVGYATDTHKFGYRTNSGWVYPSTGGITGSGTDGRAMVWSSNNAVDSSLIVPTGASVLTLSPSATCTLTVVNTASIVGTFSASGRTLTVQTGDVKLTGAGSTTELSLPNAKITFAGGGTSCSITMPNAALTFTAASGGTLTFSGNYTLTVPATGTAALLGTTNIFSVLQTCAIADSATNTIVNPLAVTHNSSSGSATAGFGTKINFNLKSTTTADTVAGDIQTEWVVGTHASRTSRMTFHVIDSGGTREVIRIQNNTTVGMLSFFGVAAVVRATAFTQTYSTSTHTAAALTYASPGAYAGGANGYNTTAQAQAIITALGQLNTDTIAIYGVVTAIIDDLQAYGLFQ